MCEICKNRRYLICMRDEGVLAVERCDECTPEYWGDEDAAILAKRDGINCMPDYPCYVLTKKGNKTPRRPRT